jgi:hypothetical protein
LNVAAREAGICFKARRKPEAYIVSHGGVVAHSHCFNLLRSDLVIGAIRPSEKFNGFYRRLWMNTVRLSLLLIITAALQLAISSYARCMNAPSDGAFDVTINLQCIGRSAAATGNTSPATTFWEVSPLPAPENVSISPNGDDIRQAILKALDAMRAKESSEGKHFRLNDRTGWDFIQNLQQNLQAQMDAGFDKIRVAAVFVKAPTVAQIGNPSTGTYKITNSINSVKHLRIVLVTEQAAKGGAEVISLDKTIGAVNQNFDLGNLTPDEQRIPVTIKYTPADEARPNGSAGTPAGAEKRLMGVAADVFNRARAAGLVLGKPAPPGNVVGGLQSAINAEYGLAGGPVQGWPTPDARVKIEDQATGTWTIGINSLRFTKDIKIKVKDEGLTKEEQQLEESLNRRYLRRLVNRPGDIPTSNQIARDKVLLNRIPEITSVAEIKSTDSDLIFVVTRRKNLVNLFLSISGGYSTDQSVFGEGKGTLSNFFHLGETLSLQAKAGRKIADYAVLFSWYGQEPLKKQRDYQIDVKAGYYRNRKQRFGNLLGPAFDDREPGVEGSFTFGFDSFTIDDDLEGQQGTSRKHIRYTLHAKPGFEYRDVEVKTRGTGTLVASGQATVFSLNLDQTISSRIKNPHIDNLSLQVTANGSKGLSILSGDFPYEQFRITASPQIVFGFQRPTDMFFRYVRGIGASSRDTPLFKLFRFGGSQNVRGLEEGEIVGRNIAFENWEAGLSTLAIWNWLHRKNPVGDKVVGGIDLSGVYVKLFYDRGRVLDESSLSELLQLAHGVRGYGIAVELKGYSIKGKRANLTLGFARSPDSKLHPIGVITSGVSFDF